jgi:hypothetical protein
MIDPIDASPSLELDEPSSPRRLSSSVTSGSLGRAPFNLATPSASSECQSLPSGCGGLVGHISLSLNLPCLLLIQLSVHRLSLSPWVTTSYLIVFLV